MKSEKFYYICKRWKSNHIEVVHPRQIRPSDNVLLYVNYDDWNEFCEILMDHKLNPTGGMHYKKVVELWNRYYTWMTNGYKK